MPHERSGSRVGDGASKCRLVERRQLPGSSAGGHLWAVLIAGRPARSRVEAVETPQVEQVVAVDDRTAEIDDDDKEGVGVIGA